MWLVGMEGYRHDWGGLWGEKGCGDDMVGVKGTAMSSCRDKDWDWRGKSRGSMRMLCKDKDTD